MVCKFKADVRRTIKLANF